MTNIKQLSACPKCGNDQFYRKAKATGYVVVCERFDTPDLEAVDNGEMYTHVRYELGNTCYCDECGKSFKYDDLRTHQNE